MSTRLQVVLDDEEFAQIRQVAEAQRLTVSEWVRQVLRRAREQEPRYRAEHKLRVVRESARYGLPSGDMEQILDETARGRAAGER